MEFQLIDQNDLLSSHIAGFFDHQYLWGGSINVLDFLHKDSLQGSGTLKEPRSTGLLCGNQH